MTEADHHRDLALAQEICSELRSGNNEAILNIYNPYHHFFIGYTRRRVQSIDPDRANTILTDFWVELLNAKAICDYKGLASLKTYLFKILNFRIVDSLRRAKRQTGHAQNISDKDHEMDGFKSGTVSPESDLMHKEKIRLVHETLLLLSESSPTDAWLVKMHMEGLDYTQMAKQMLGNQDFTQRQLNKKVNAIKETVYPQPYRLFGKIQGLP